MSTIPLNLETDAVALSLPSLSPQITLDQALKKRHSTRTFLPDMLSLDTLSALLWAGFGINRPDRGGRTAPSAHNWQEIDLYVVLAEGAYRYDVRANRLILVKAEDLRRHTGTQDFIAQNIYLYCAGAGLATVVRGLINRRVLAHALNLTATQRIALAQTVGYPGPQA